MGITRRNTLIGLGALAGGAGMVGASGAFDSVEANRSFEVSVAGDAAALLGITVTNTTIAATEAAGAGDNEVIVFTLENEDSGASGSGLNENAISAFFEVFTLANNGSQDVTVTIDGIDGLTFTVTDGGADLADGVAVDVGESIDVDLAVDTTTDGGYVEPADGDDPHQLSIVAESAAAAE